MSQANERHSVLSGEYVKERATWEELSKQRQEYEQTSEIELQCVRKQAEYRRLQDEHKRLTETHAKLQKELEQAEHAMETMRVKQTDCEKNASAWTPKLSTLSLKPRYPNRCSTSSIGLPLRVQLKRRISNDMWSRLYNG